MEKAESKTSAWNYENWFRKYDGEMTLCVKIVQAAGFRHQCELQQQFADSVVRNMDKYVFVHDFSHLCVQYVVCIQQWIF